MNPPDLRGGYRTTVDFTINRPKEISIANCIKARVDAGISNFRRDGSGILELQDYTETEL